VEEDGGRGGGGGGGGGERKMQGGEYKIVDQPCLAGHVRWRLLFHCCVAHPSVMMRKAAVVRCGGYVHASSSPPPFSSSSASSSASDSDVAHVEDYYLWLRLVGLLPSPASDACAAATGAARGGRSDVKRCLGAAEDAEDAGGGRRSEGHEGGGYRDYDDGDGECQQIYNTGDVLLLLRKHSNNVSARHAPEQAANALKLRQRALSRLQQASPHMRDTETPLPNAVRALARPEQAGSCKELKEAQAQLQLLRSLSAQILRADAAAGQEAEEEAALAQRAVDLEIEGRAAEIGTEALKRVASGDPLAMQVWREWLTLSQSSPCSSAGSNMSGNGGGAGQGSAGGAASSAPHPLLSLLKGLGRS